MYSIDFVITSEMTSLDPNETVPLGKKSECMPVAHIFICSMVDSLPEPQFQRRLATSLQATSEYIPLY
jgi:hypothetical protein